MQTRVHINLTVSDLAASIGFYEAMFGVPATKRRDDYANFRLDAPALHLALVQATKQQPAAVGDSNQQHFGIELFDDGELAAWRERVTNLRPVDEQQVTCCYAVADKFWLADPDGHAWEFWVRHAEADRLTRQLAGESAPDSGCCAPDCCAPVGAAKSPEPAQQSAAPASVNDCGCGGNC